MKYLTIILYLTISYSQLPKYAYNMCDHFQLNYRLMENWSFAESTHNKYANDNGCFGRHNISKPWLEDYLKWTGQSITNIKNVRKFLENDRNNCWIAYYSLDHYLRKGFTWCEFFQIFLWGIGNFRKGRYSISYEDKIFKGFDKELYK